MDVIKVWHERISPGRYKGEYNKGRVGQDSWEYIQGNDFSDFPINTEGTKKYTYTF